MSSAVHRHRLTCWLAARKKILDEVALAGCSEKNERPFVVAVFIQ
jgi:hypothetical protein